MQDTTVDTATTWRGKARRAVKPSSRRARWSRRILVAAAVLLVLVVGGSVGLAWYFSGKSIGTGRGGGAATPDRVLAVREDSGRTIVALTDSASTRRPGVHGLSWGGGSAMLGDIVGTGHGQVQRPLLRGATPLPGTEVALEWNYPTDPRAVLDVDLTTVTVPTDLGDAPAWYLPGDRSTWVIAVHGGNGKQSTMLPSVATLNRLGLPALVITYRNDLGAPKSPDELSHLGATEWRDVDAAMRTAVRLGAKRFLLAGSSMGGAIVGQTMVHSPLADRVDALVLDAPAIDFELINDFQAGLYGAPAPLSWLTKRIVEWRAGVDLERLRLIAHPPRHRPPMLLLHGTADREIPVASSRALAAAAPRLHWPISYEEFPGAAHTQSWNMNPARYEGVIERFARRTVINR